MSNDNNVFEYTYSARQQEEIKKIRNKYIPREEDKMAQLRRLDASAGSKATRAALCLGIPSALVLGLGMSCCMVWGGWAYVPGILLGITGIAGACLAYPAYNRTLKKEQERIAPEILRLTEELMQ